ncbi:MAG: hypothetical protein QXR66_03915, partial [Thermoplasmatales archaeon]
SQMEAVKKGDSVENNGDQKKLRKLNMRKNEEFRFLLGKYLKDLPESVRGSIFGSIYAKAAKNGVVEARNYVLVKRKEGLIDEETSRKLIDLLYDYSTFR